MDKKSFFLGAAIALVLSFVWVYVNGFPSLRLFQQAPFPCSRCIALGDRTWFVGEVDPSRPYDGILLAVMQKQKDGSMTRVVKRYRDLSFTQPPSAAATAATTKAIAEGKKDLAGAEATVKR